MIIRLEQVEALNRIMRERLERRVFAHLLRRFARPCRELGEHQVWRTIGVGIERAKSLNIRRERDVIRYVAIMIAYGSDFHQTRPWAAAILAAPLHSSWKIERLFDEARSRYEQEGESQ
jgi:hypothetical protein